MKSLISIPAGSVGQIALYSCITYHIALFHNRNTQRILMSNLKSVYT